MKRGMVAQQQQQHGGMPANIKQDGADNSCLLRRIDIARFVDFSNIARYVVTSLCQDVSMHFKAFLDIRFFCT